MIFDTFKDTIFIKEDSSLQKQYEALLKLQKEYPNNNTIAEELYIAKKGLEGEKEIQYQLSKSNLGLYVIHDLNIEYENLKAQIDYIVLSKAYCYFIECKNLVGNITINDRGEFIREYVIYNKKIKKGMYSPLRQVEAQRDVYKKIWNITLSQNKIINSIKRALAENNFTDTHRTLVVVSNNDTILKTKYAPKEIKNKVIRADNLIRTIENDLKKSDKDLWYSKSEMERWANNFLRLNVEKNIDYYEMYKQKYIDNHSQTQESNDQSRLKNRLIEFRKTRSREMNIPAYYVFNNDELEKLLLIKPKTIDELTKSKILTPIKVKTHGKQIVEIINGNK